MTKAPPEAYLVEELASFFDCSDDAISERLACGDLPGVKIGKHWIIPSAAFHERLNEKAREEASQRRAALQAPQPAAETKRASTAHIVTAGRRPARTPPPLPGLPTAGQPDPRP